MKIKHLLPILLLLFLVPATTASYVSIELDLETTYDGDVTTSEIDATSVTAYSYAHSTGLPTQLIFLEFDISSIPAGSTIDSVNLTYNCTSTGGWNWQDRLKFFGLDDQPSVTDAATLHASGGLKYREVLQGTEGIATYDLDYNGNAVSDLQTAVDSGVDWFAISIYGQKGAIGGDDITFYIQTIESADIIPTLGVTFYPEAPYCHSPYPAQGEVEVEAEPQLSIQVTNPNPVGYNITWQWYNSDDSTWYSFQDNASFDSLVGTYTYYANFENATSSGETYYWRVNATDDTGNWSLSEEYYFTLEGYLPPSDASCSRINDTAINISWTPFADPTNISTICYYQLGYDPPDWEEGTFGFNTTESYYVVNGLDEGECYSFSLWSNTNESGNWTLSSTRTFVLPCCTGGGQYTICFRYENSTYDPATGTSYNNYINFSHYPCSTHLLTIHYPNEYDTYRFLDSTWYENNGNLSCISVNTSEEPLYFEFHWNWSVNLTCSECVDQTSYSRKLTPYAAISNNLTFYMITDRRVYNEYYGVNDSGNCTTSSEPEYELNNNLVQFDFQFEDRTHLFDTFVGEQTYSTFYAYNTTTKIIVHQEYWDAQQQVHPFLIYQKKYFVGVNNTQVSSGYRYENVGLAPNWQWVYPYEARTIIINYFSDEISYYTDEYTIDYGWSSGSTGLWVYYLDTTYSTSILNCTITNLTGTRVYSLQVSDTDEKNFTFPTANQSQSYFVYLNITISIDGEIQTIPLTFWILPSETHASIADTIDTMLIAIFGALPSRTAPDGSTVTMNYNNIIIGITAIITLSFTPLIGIGASMLLTGISMLFISSFIYGISIISTIYPYASIFIIFIGILIFLAGRSST